LRDCARSLFIALILFGLLNLQIQPSLHAAEAKPFGVIALADHAQVGSATASNGATVYPGDTVATDGGGTLRFIIGKGQVYLLSASAATLGENAGVLSASVLRGTVGFSSLTAQQFQLDTPEGVVRAANGLPAFGQVTLTGPKELNVTAFKGTLLLERGSQTLAIQAGQTYDVSLVPDDSEGSSQNPAGVKSALNEHLVWRIIVIGVAGGVGYWLWRHFSESPIDPK
jgi:hypothetical protein